MSKPTFGQWDYFLHRKWNPPEWCKTKKATIVDFAMTLETWSQQGEIYPSNKTVAKVMGVTPRYVRELRSLCVKLGLFRDTGRVKAYDRSTILPIYEIAIPDAEPAEPAVSEIPKSANVHNVDTILVTECPLCMANYHTGGRLPDIWAAHEQARAISYQQGGGTPSSSNTLLYITTIGRTPFLRC
jgi:hypothetical protein